MIFEDAELYNAGSAPLHVQQLCLISLMASDGPGSQRGIRHWVLPRLNNVSVQLKLAFDAAAAKAVTTEKQVNDLKMELMDLRNHDRRKRHCST